MKYMKMFEQENWWLDAKDHGEKIPPLNIDGLVLMSGGLNSYHIAEGIKNDVVLNLYKGYKYMMNIANSGWSIVESKDDVNKNAVVNVHNGKNWETCTFEKLSEEIKNNLVWTKK